MGEMYQLVLVDDKKDIVQGIAAGVDWESRGVEVSCFYNGRDALTHILKHHPDMVITDIRMPFLDGLELAREVVKVYQDIRIVILTGYDDFTYAREAIRLGVVEYLSKPVRLQAIEELVDHGMELSRQKKQKEQGQAVIRQQFRRNLPSLRNQWFAGVLRQGKLTEQELREKFAELEIGLKSFYFIAAVVEQDASDTPETEQEVEVIQYAIENMGKELLMPMYNCETFRYMPRRTVFLMNYQPEKNSIVLQYELYSIFSDLQGKMSAYFQRTVSVGIGGASLEVDGLVLSCRQAAEALEQKFYNGYNTITSIYDVPEKRQDLSAYPVELQDVLIGSVRKGDAEETAEVVAEYFDTIGEMRYLRPLVLREKLMHFLLKICHECKSEEELRITDLLGELEKRKTLSSIRNWMTEVVISLAKESAGGEVSDIQRNVMKVKSYIDEHYAENVSLKSMSEYVYISQSYLSLSFKEIVGVNFNDYVTSVRMEKAKEFLTSSDRKVYEVCEMVGYKDKKYFTDLFKKYTGKLPKEWSRKEKR